MDCAKNVIEKSIISKLVSNMDSLINKRVKIIKGRDKDKFGMILEITNESEGKPTEFLIELNQGKISNYPAEDVEVLTFVNYNKEGKVDIN